MIRLNLKVLLLVHRNLNCANQKILIKIIKIIDISFNQVIVVIFPTPNYARVIFAPPEFFNEVTL